MSESAGHDSSTSSTLLELSPDERATISAALRRHSEMIGNAVEALASNIERAGRLDLNNETARALLSDVIASAGWAEEAAAQTPEGMRRVVQELSEAPAVTAPETGTTAEQTAEDSRSDITVYSTPGCPGCFATKRALDKSGIEYNSVDLSERPDLVEKFRQQGLNQAPIVEAGDERWSGYRPDKMKQLDQSYQQRRREPPTNRDAHIPSQ